MTVAAVAAMDSELHVLLERLETVTRTQRAGMPFYSGTIGGCSVVLVCCGIGKVNAAMGTTLAIEHYAPGGIINTGVAGSFDRSLVPGSLVLSTRVRHLDVDACPFGYEPGQVPGMPAVYEADGRLLDMARGILDTRADIRTAQGLVVSGDRFIHEPDDVERIRRIFPDALAGDMESAAIAQVCYHYRTPFLVLRAVSDLVGGGGNSGDYEVNLESTAARAAGLAVDLILALSRS